ncbi:MAG: aminotransferase class I/II-fold pyridoxal phosphate-dependent enzyme [Polaromonas sp.]|nr:aminotransferase class I/II-fold pyridoxal phosphate-dependent enzyme [Polaromonas sp.]
MQVLERKPSPALAAFRNPALGSQLTQRIARDFTPRWNQQRGGKFMLHGIPPDPTAIRLDGNDYLGVTGHLLIVQAQIDALRKEQEFVAQSGVFHRNEHPARALEMALATWVGKDDGFICQSGHAANVGLLQAIVDAQTPVYLDTLAHASLWEDAHAARAPAFAFRHNDTAHLARVIAKNGPGIVVVDSVYSTTGALCSLVELVELVEVAEQHGCMILVDESHSLGTQGPQGAGLCAALGLSERVHFITVSLAKAFAGRAGFFTAPAHMRHLPLATCHLPVASGLTAASRPCRPGRPSTSGPCSSGRWPRHETP